MMDDSESNPNPKLHVTQVQLVIAYASQETLLARLDTVLTKLAKVLNAKRVSPRTIPPGLSPEIPRTLLLSQNTIIQIALNRTEVMVTPPDHVAADAGTATQYFTNVLNGVLSDLFMSLPRSEWAGGVMHVHYRVPAAKSALEAIGPVFKKLVSIPNPETEIATFNLTFGTKTEHHFRNVTVQGYQFAEIVAGMSASGLLDLPADQGSVTEAGIQFVLDINNKPASSKSTPVVELTKILEQLKIFCEKAPLELGLVDLLPQ